MGETVHIHEAKKKKKKKFI